MCWVLLKKETSSNGMPPTRMIYKRAPFWVYASRLQQLLGCLVVRIPPTSVTTAWTTPCPRDTVQMSKFEVCLPCLKEIMKQWSHRFSTGMVEHSYEEMCFALSIEHLPRIFSAQCSCPIAFPRLLPPKSSIGSLITSKGCRTINPKLHGNMVMFATCSPLKFWSLQDLSQ